MAIQVRRGLYKDFEPSKMLPGEWAVSIDAETQNQVVWMCFSAGVVKRMGTYEDFVQQVTDATKDVRDDYIAEFNAILNSIQDDVNSVAVNKDIVLQIKSDIINVYLPQIQDAYENAVDAENSATEAQSYAVGGTGSRENENVDNSKYYYEQSKQISQGLAGALLPMGTITFTQLDSQTKQSGYMFNISDAFTTDDTFKEGAGFSYPEGTNVYYTADGFWDCLAGTAVTGVKGDLEGSYRNGNVNISKDNIGLGNVDNTADNEKSVFSASKLTTPRKIGNADFDGTKDITLEEIGAGGTSNVDDELSETSENPVQNKVVTAAIEEINSNLSKVVGTITTDTKWTDVNAFLYKRGGVAHLRFYGRTVEAINAGTTALTVDVLPTKSVSQIPTLMNSTGTLSGTIVTIGTNGNCSFSANLSSGIYVSFDFEYDA